MIAAAKKSSGNRESYTWKKMDEDQKELHSIFVLAEFNPVQVKAFMEMSLDELELHRLHDILRNQIYDETKPRT